MAGARDGPRHPEHTKHTMPATTPIIPTTKALHDQLRKLETDVADLRRQLDRSKPIGHRFKPVSPPCSDSSDSDVEDAPLDRMAIYDTLSKMKVTAMRAHMRANGEVLGQLRKDAKLADLLRNLDNVNANDWTGKVLPAIARWADGEAEDNEAEDGEAEDGPTAAPAPKTRNAIYEELKGMRVTAARDYLTANPGVLTQLKEDAELAGLLKNLRNAMTKDNWGATVLPAIERWSRK